MALGCSAGPRSGMIGWETLVLSQREGIPLIDD